MSHLIFGVFAVCAGLFGVFVWWDDFGLVLRGLIPITLIVVGLIGVGAGLVGRKRPIAAADDGEPEPRRAPPPYEGVGAPVEAEVAPYAATRRVSP